MRARLGVPEALVSSFGLCICGMAWCHRLGINQEVSSTKRSNTLVVARAVWRLPRGRPATLASVCLCAAAQWH
jgi:hypothetical protein